MSYWGLAKQAASNWSTVDWLEDQLRGAIQQASPEEFAQRITERLGKAISRMRFARLIDAGIGIHFTAYEYIDDYWIPELFLISNWADESYQSLRPTGIGLSRETYKTIARVPASPKHRERQYRLRVHEYLRKSGRMLVFNNGDPRMFNTAANAIFGMFGELSRRGNMDYAQRIETYLSFARRPIEIVSEAQRDFCREGTRIVGGKPHDLAITPGGEYHSTTGDKY